MRFWGELSQEHDLVDEIPIGNGVLNQYIFNNLGQLKLFGSTLSWRQENDHL